MFKKLKKGDYITLRKKKYRVIEAYDSKVKCRMCMQHNQELPCAPKGQVNDETWNRKKCLERLSAKCYLKHEESNKESGT